MEDNKHYKLEDKKPWEIHMFLMPASPR